jgi:oligoendopeptidase F
MEELIDYDIEGYYELLLERLSSANMKVKDLDSMIDSAINNIVKHELIQERAGWLKKKEHCEHELDLIREMLSTSGSSYFKIVDDILNNYFHNLAVKDNCCIAN